VAGVVGWWLGSVCPGAGWLLCTLRLFWVNSISGKSISGKSISGKSISGKSILGKSILGKSILGKSIFAIVKHFAALCPGLAKCGLL
jgi:hypothetical protein